MSTMSLELSNVIAEDNGQRRADDYGDDEAERPQPGAFQPEDEGDGHNPDDDRRQIDPSSDAGADPMLGPADPTRWPRSR